MKAVLLLGSDRRVPAWQFDALSEAVEAGLDVIVVAFCTDNVRRSSPIRFALYYLLALAGRLSNKAVKRRDIMELLADDVPTISFASQWEGSWQRIPDDIAATFNGADVVVKFGMNLLRDPEGLPVPLGVLSYHHGDPRLFRGRPAGFYEMVHRSSTVGSCVQRLSNTLDGGEILAVAQAPVRRYSYAKTLQGAYMAGVPLLGLVVRNGGRALVEQSPSLGPNYRLPRNRVVMSLAFRLLSEKGRRLGFGLFGERRWRVGRVVGSLELEGNVSFGLADIRALEVPPGCSFVADPCGLDGDRLFCEALDSSSGRGRIVQWDGVSWRNVGLEVQGKHASYPQVVEWDGAKYLLPEIASFGPPRLFEIADDGSATGRSRPLKGLEHRRLIDGTLLRHGELWILFAGSPDSFDYRLDLWTARSPIGPFELHPSSPICVDTRGARMGGPIAKQSQSLYRLGQDSSSHYGGALSVFRIDVLDRDHYSESRVGAVSIANTHGPHTLTLDEKGAWLDFYTVTWSPLAWWRRVRARLL